MNMQDGDCREIAVNVQDGDCSEIGVNECAGR